MSLSEYLTLLVCVGPLLLALVFATRPRPRGYRPPPSPAKLPRPTNPGPVNSTPPEVMIEHHDVRIES